MSSSAEVTYENAAAESQTYKSSRYNIWYKGKNAHYLYNIFSTGMLALNGRLVHLVEQALQNPAALATLSSGERELLVKNGFFVPLTVDELDMVKFRYRKGVFDRSRFTLTLIPTLACNLACPYCFEHEKGKKSMDADDCLQVLKFIERELRDIRPTFFGLIWYGGEPLLAIELIEKLAADVARLCEKLKIEQMPGGMVSNGYLLTEMNAKRLKQAGIQSIQITLDGDRDHHDRSRVRPGGGGTFDRIYQAIRIAHDAFDHVAVRFNTNKENLPGIRRLVGEDPLLREKKVTIYIAPLKSYMGGKMKREEDRNQFSGSELQRVQHEIDLLLGRVDHTPASSRPFYEFFVKTNNCGGDQLKTFIIGPGGKVYKCFEHVDPGREVGTIQEGEFVPGANYWQWAINEPFDHSCCRRCAYLPVCMGGCPSMRRRLGVPNDEICGYWQEWLETKLRQIDEDKSGPEKHS